MLQWAFLFLIVAVSAALFGFGGVAAAGMTKVLFLLFTVLFIVFLVTGLVSRVSVTPRL